MKHITLKQEIETLDEISLEKFVSELNDKLLSKLGFQVWSELTSRDEEHIRQFINL